MTPRLRDISEGPVHPFCNTNVDAGVHPRLRDTSGDPVHQFCNTNVVLGVRS
jgi:hypothetical protein